MLENPNKTSPELREAVATYFKVGILSFGGPAAQIALMHKIFVDEKQWLDEREYLNALSFCMLLPGPEAMQMATYVGWRLHGCIGGLMAGLLFVLPGAIIIFMLAFFYAYFGTTDWMKMAFLGVKSAVLVIVIEALLRVSKKALLGYSHWIIAAISFIGIFVFELPYPIIVAIAGIYGFLTAKKDQVSTTQAHKISFTRTLKTLFIWLCIWFLPLLVIGWMTGWGFVYDIGVFFSKLAAVTFGGAYAVLAYMSQEVVFELKWLTTAQMMDGLGLAETTPGPLILVTQFVGFIAGMQEGGLLLAFVVGIVVLWVTFAPCFLWIFVGAPYIEWISAQPRLKNALSSITAAVVGVILSLSIWFGLHVLFEDVSKTQFGWISIWQPSFVSIDIFVLAVFALSFYLLIIKHMNILLVLTVSAFLGLCYGLVV